MTQVPGQEADYLPTDLKQRAIRIEVEPVHALHLEADMPGQHVVDVHHARHAHKRAPRGPACPARSTQTSASAGGGWEAGRPPYR